MVEESLAVVAGEDDQRRALRGRLKGFDDPLHLRIGVADLGIVARV